MDSKQRLNLIDQIFHVVKKGSPDRSDELLAQDLKQWTDTQLQDYYDKCLAGGLILSPLEEETIAAAAYVAANKEIKKLQATAVEQEQISYDRRVFSSFAKDFGYADIDANFNISRRLLFDNFTKHNLAQAVQDGRLQLAPATRDQINQWTKEAAEARVDYLQNQATPTELRQAAREESLQRQQSANQAHFEQQLEIARQRDAAIEKAYGRPFPDIPAHKDKEYFRKTSGAEMRVEIKRYGLSKVTDRINGRG